MSKQDPIADMLTRIRNAQMANHQTVEIPGSKMKVQILNVLKEEGYIRDFREEKNGAMSQLTVALKYYEGRPVIDKIRRASRPGLRLYASGKDVKNARVSGFGIKILTTSKGIMSDKQARQHGVGGEVICEVA